jgi:cell division protein FtsQ
MSPRYQGRALETHARIRPRRPVGRAGRVLRVLSALGMAAALAHLPWRDWAARVATVGEVHVEGLRYLEAARVASVAGVARGQSLFRVDATRARARLLLHPRIESAEVGLGWPRDVRIRVVERQPVLLVRHGAAWELYSAGVLLPPLEPGVVADVPLLTGVDLEALPQGARVAVPGVRRGVAWARALAVPALDLMPRVSEIDVARDDATGLVMMNGARVLASAWPPGTRDLSALRVVLVDLERRGTLARELDLRFQGQVIVRPAENQPAASDSTRQNAGA